MTVQRQIGFWIVALRRHGPARFMCSADILLPFVAGFALAYLLDPLADRLQRLGLGRLGGDAHHPRPLRPRLHRRAGAARCRWSRTSSPRFVDRLPAYAARLQALAVEQGGPLVERLGGADALADMQRSLGNLVGQAMAWVGAFLTRLWSGGQAILSVFALLVVTPVVAFYLLVDWDRMVATVDGWLPLRTARPIRALARDIDAAIAGFVRGQATVCLILGTFYAVGLSLVGLNFGALIGMAAGLLSFIPYVGSLTGLLLSVGVADRPVLAGLDLDPRDTRGIRVRPVRRRQHPVAEARRGARSACIRSG